MFKYLQRCKNLLYGRRLKLAIILGIFPILVFAVAAWAFASPTMVEYGSEGLIQEEAFKTTETLEVVSLPPDQVAGFSGLEATSTIDSIDLTGSTDSSSTPDSTETPDSIDLTSYSVSRGRTNIVINALELRAPAGDGVVVDALTFHLNGTAKQGPKDDIPAARIWIDDGDFIFEPAIAIDGPTADTLVANPIFESDEIMFGDLNLEIAPNSSRHVFLAIDIANSAKVGKTIASCIEVEDIAVASPDKVELSEAASGGIRDGITITDGPDAMLIVPTTSSIASTTDTQTVLAGTDDNFITFHTLSVDGDGAIVKSMTFNRIGTADDSDTKRNGIKLWMDTDNSGNVTPGDTQLSTSGTFKNGAVTFEDISLEVKPATPIKAILTYSITKNAETGATVGSQIADASKVVVEDPDAVELAATPLSSSLKAVGESAR